MSALEACLFDLDGVIVDTAKYHYLAWRQIADGLGFEFTPAHNERLKGVSRQRSLDILLEVGGVALDTAEKTRLAEQKNGIYLDYIKTLTPGDILPGAAAFLAICIKAGLKTGLATASRNASVILDRLEIGPLFDVVMDGNNVSRTKPDPEVFLNCARDLGIAPAGCAVFEDAEAGIAAAKSAGMLAVGIGEAEILREADVVVAGLKDMSLDLLKSVWDNKKRVVLSS